MAKSIIKLFNEFQFQSKKITMNINTLILNTLSFPVNYLEKKQQITSTVIYLFSIVMAALIIIMLLSFQIFYIL
jgi:uncharacterized integral membrane protein